MCELCLSRSLYAAGAGVMAQPGQAGRNMEQGLQVHLLELCAHEAHGILHVVQALCRSTTAYMEWCQASAHITTIHTAGTSVNSSVNITFATGCMHPADCRQHMR